jgi:hypothetical protein
MNNQTLAVKNESILPSLGMIPQDYVEIKESLAVHAMEDKEGSKKRLAVKLINEGWSKNGYYYSAKVAESIADHIKERPQMYMDHDMFGSMMGRSFKDLVAVAVDSYTEKGAAYAIVEMVDNPSTAWLYDLAKQFPGQVGASIDARAKVKEYEESPEEGETKANEPQKYVVEEIIFLNSVDFVTYPAAGGGVVEVMASQIVDEATRKFTSVMEEFRNQVANLQTPTEDTSMEETKVVMTKEALLADYPEIAEELRKDYEADFEAKAEEESSIHEWEAKVEDLEKKLEEATKANDEFKTELDEYKVKEKVEAKRKKVEDAITDSKLDPAFVSEVFIEDLMKVDDETEIQDRIKDRLELVESATGEVSGNGQRTTEDSTTEEQEDAQTFDMDALVKSIKSYRQFI